MLVDALDGTKLNRRKPYDRAKYIQMIVNMARGVQPSEEYLASIVESRTADDISRDLKLYLRREEEARKRAELPAAMEAAGKLREEHARLTTEATQLRVKLAPLLTTLNEIERQLTPLLRELRDSENRNSNIHASTFMVLMESASFETEAQQRHKSSEVTGITQEIEQKRMVLANLAKQRQDLTKLEDELRDLIEANAAGSIDRRVLLSAKILSAKAALKSEPKVTREIAELEKRLEHVERAKAAILAEVTRPENMRLHEETRGQ